MISWCSNSIVNYFQKILVLKLFVLLHVFKNRNLIKEIIRCISIVDILVFSYYFYRKILLKIIIFATVNSGICSYSQNWPNFEITISQGKNFDDPHYSLINFKSVIIWSCIVFPKIFSIITRNWLSFTTIFAFRNRSVHGNLIFKVVVYYLLKILHIWFLIVYYTNNIFYVLNLLSQLLLQYKYNFFICRIK